jgi:hypothetical protein
LHAQLPSTHEQIHASTREQPSIGPTLAWHCDMPEHERPCGSALAAQLFPRDRLQPFASETAGHVGWLPNSGQRLAYPPLDDDPLALDDVPPLLDDELPPLIGSTLVVHPAPLVASTRTAIGMPTDVMWIFMDPPRAAKDLPLKWRGPRRTTQHSTSRSPQVDVQRRRQGSDDRKAPGGDLERAEPNDDLGKRNTEHAADPKAQRGRADAA